MSRRDEWGEDALEWTLPDINALKPPDDPEARAKLRADMQSSWTGEIPVLRDLAGPPADAQAPGRRGRHASTDDEHPAPDGTEPGRAWLQVPRPEGRRGRHAVVDVDETAEIANLSAAVEQHAAAVEQQPVEPAGQAGSDDQTEAGSDEQAAPGSDETESTGPVSDDEPTDATAASVPSRDQDDDGPEDRSNTQGSPDSQIDDGADADDADDEDNADAVADAVADDNDDNDNNDDNDDNDNNDDNNDDNDDNNDNNDNNDDNNDNNDNDDQNAEGGGKNGAGSGGRTRGFGLRAPALVVGVAAACLFTGGAGTVAAMDKSVTITVDGQPREVSTLSGDVAGALTAAGLTVGAHDALAPTPGTAIQDGSQIRLDRGRLLTVVLDGHERQVWTTARTVDAALAQLGADDSRLQLSANRSRSIPLQGLAVTGTTEHTVLLTVAGHPKSDTTSAATVADLLRQNKIVLDDDDQVVPSGATAVTDGLAVTVTRHTVVRSTERRTLAQPADRTVRDNTVRRHVTTVTEGHAGVEELQYRAVTTNGHQGARKLISIKVVRPATATTTHVGTKIVEEKDAWNVPWDKMAMCESSGKWDINTGNGTYGGLQFETATWLSMGGGDFASRADLATKAQQIEVAERLYAQQGLAPWHCARLQGWGFGKYTGGW